MRFISSMNSVLLCVCAILALLVRAESVRSEEQNPFDTFAMTTKVFQEKSKAPLLSTETLFLDQVAYDRVTSDAAKSDLSQQVIKFDFKARVATIVDLKSKVTASKGFAEIDSFQAAAAAVAIERGGLMGFLAKPQFQNVFDSKEGTIRLESPWLTYEAAGKQGPPQLVQRYTDFATWSKKLSTMLDANAPAQARVRLNQRLKKQNWQPNSITLTGGPKAVQLGKITSQQRYQNGLNKEQRNFIQLVESHLKESNEISFDRIRALRKSLRPQ